MPITVTESQFVVITGGTAPQVVEVGRAGPQGPPGTVDYSHLARTDDSNTFTEYPQVFGPLTITAAGDRPVIKFANTDSQQGLSFRSHDDFEVMRLQNNHAVVLPNGATMGGGLNVATYPADMFSITRGGNAQGIRFGSINEPSVMVESPSGYASSTTFAVKARVGQSEDLFQAQDSTGQPVAAIGGTDRTKLDLRKGGYTTTIFTYSTGDCYFDVGNSRAIHFRYDDSVSAHASFYPTGAYFYNPLNAPAGVVLTSPNGTRYRLVVANDGTLSTTPA